MNYIQSADGTLALRLEAHEALVISNLLYGVQQEDGLWITDETRGLIAAIRNAAATLNHE